MDLELHFKQWLEDVGITPGNQYSNAEDPNFAVKVRSDRSARGDQREKERGWDHDEPSAVFGNITNFGEPPPGSLPKNPGTNMAQMKKGMKKKMRK